MGKILGSWSGMRRYLEQEMLAEPLKGRITYACTTYPGMDGCKLFEIRVDGKTAQRFSMETAAKDAAEGQKDLPLWQAYGAQKGLPASGKNAHDDEAFAAALATYRAIPIGQAIEHDNPLVRLFAILDRRIGKRTLLRVKDTIERQPAWLRPFYTLRLDAGGISS